MGEGFKRGVCARGSALLARVGGCVCRGCSSQQQQQRPFLPPGCSVHLAKPMGFPLIPLYLFFPVLPNPPTPLSLFPWPTCLVHLSLTAAFIPFPAFSPPQCTVFRPSHLPLPVSPFSPTFQLNPTPSPTSVCPTSPHLFHASFPSSPLSLSPSHPIFSSNLSPTPPLPSLPPPPTLSRLPLPDPPLPSLPPRALTTPLRASAE
ncbi:unnamed protein product [Closterium sp. NIES-65]|nr:unnamed protein product [Closterium sp. NIES-65]